MNNSFLISSTDTIAVETLCVGPNSSTWDADKNCLAIYEDVYFSTACVRKDKNVHLR